MSSTPTGAVAGAPHDRARRGPPRDRRHSRAWSTPPSGPRPQKESPLWTLKYSCLREARSARPAARLAVAAHVDSRAGHRRSVDHHPALDDLPAACRLVVPPYPSLRTILGVLRSGLIIEVPESEPADASWWERLDPAGRHSASQPTSPSRSSSLPCTGSSFSLECSKLSRNSAKVHRLRCCIHLSLPPVREKALWLGPRTAGAHPSDSPSWWRDAFPSSPFYGGQF